MNYETHRPDRTRKSGWFRRLHGWGVRHPKHYYVTPPSAWAVMIYGASLLPPRELERLPLWSFPGSDKLDHLAAYAVLSLLVLRGWERGKRPAWGLHGLTFVLCLLFGAMIEIHQGLLGARTFEAADIAADAAGAALGQALWHAWTLWGGARR